MFRVVKGVAEAKKLIRKLKPDLVFSKGGFVAVPVVLGAKSNNVPVIIHESDITPGLANKIAMPSARVVCSTFPETLQYVPKGKGVHTGTPIRKELFEGDRQKGLAACRFTGEKPVLLMMGGSLGAVKLNNCLREILPELVKTFDVIHLCGKGNLDGHLRDQEGYMQFEYVSDGLNDLFAAADFIVSRAGSNSISEFLALKKPHLLIPLSAKASRGDQILNAASFEKQGFARVLDEDEMTAESMKKEIFELFENKDKYVAAMENASTGDGVDAVMDRMGDGHAALRGIGGQGDGTLGKEQTDLHAGLQAVQFGHHQVQNDQVKPPGSGQFHRAAVQYLCPQRRHLQHLVIGDHIQLSCARYFSWICCVNSIYVAIYFASICI
mgnify:CR=1 FL=1